MILKTFINLFNLNYIILFFIYIFIVNKFLTTINLRQKFILLFINFIVIISISLWYSLDGIVLLFILCELSIFLIFIVMYSQLYSYYSFKSNITSVIILFFIILILNISSFNFNIVNFKNFYSNNIFLNDFMYIYNFYFEKSILVTIFTLFIITLFSIFFILLYFSIKLSQKINIKKKKNIYLLRKQNTVHQSNYNTKIRIFK